jgi:hypothetical protein
MKKILLTAIFGLFFAAFSFASSNIVKPVAQNQEVKKEVVTKTVNGDNLKPGDIEKYKQEVSKNPDLCVLITWEDGSWLEICCSGPCIIIIIFE